MRLRDYLRIGWDQLKRRKVVTAMCACGIAIGSSAIIVALSLGESSQKYAQEQVNAFLKIDEITIMDNSEGNSGEPSNESPDDYGKVTKQKLDLIRSFPHVKAVATFKDLGYFPFVVDDQKNGRVNLIATDLDTLTYFDKEFKQGNYSDQPNTIVLSYGATLGLYDERTDEIRNKQLQANPDNKQLREMYRSLDKVPTPLYQKGIKLLITGNPSGSGQPKVIEVPARVTGVLNKPSGVPEDSIPYMKEAYISHEMAEQIQNAMKESTGSNAGMERFDSYARVVVKVDDTKHVKALDEKIKKLKLNTQNNLHQQDRLNEQFAVIRTVALGVGLFVLFIASISIVVAMTMSTYQRRKQIGVMKVLGANLRQIRNMFIVESALLGLLGGMVGILLSYWVVWGINGLLSAVDSGTSELIFISTWILGVGIFFAVLTGVLSGIYPAISASRTDALTAIKRD
ncbi:MULTISPECIES: ABC transporter permease [unclassified Paenibacillus]|uniref:ABC transporter permease n=1 Tax=unclassified Paenibacillus TaxID=185978 RepID=UPI001C1009DB|nr:MULTISPECIES: ABC transporter permease [unclassified Paenibacillus]MBU5441378.1 ABC transporter permease [Paenibacillus sp. MSJ-34]CAH0118243.1 ABC transporter permease YtrF [Paenibacillus sp. CECT 9249]